MSNLGGNRKIFKVYMIEYENNALLCHRLDFEC